MKLSREERMCAREESKRIAEIMFKNPRPKQVGYIRVNEKISRILYRKESIIVMIWNLKMTKEMRRRKIFRRKSSPLKECITI